MSSDAIMKIKKPLPRLEPFRFTPAKTLLPEFEALDRASQDLARAIGLRLRPINGDEMNSVHRSVSRIGTAMLASAMRKVCSAGSAEIDSLKGPS